MMMKSNQLPYYKVGKNVSLKRLSRTNEWKII